MVDAIESPIVETLSTIPVQTTRSLREPFPALYHPLRLQGILFPRLKANLGAQAFCLLLRQNETLEGQAGCLRFQAAPA
jgi:hypothetical protein